VVTIKIPIAVKTVVTEGWRRRMAVETQESLRRVEGELEQIGFQLRRVAAEREKNPNPELDALAAKLQEEASRRQQRRQQLRERVKEIARLQLGAVVVEGTVEGLVEVKVGDRWQQVAGTEIILQDGVVVAIGAAGPGDEPCDPE
jgi:hypothetical protein